MNEADITKQIMALLDSMGAYNIKHHVSQFSTAGVPDVLACLNGRFIGIEVKKDARLVPSKIQEFHLQRIRAAGGIAFHTHSLNDCIDKLRDNWPSARDQMYQLIGQSPLHTRSGEGRATGTGPRSLANTDAGADNKFD